MDLRERLGDIDIYLLDQGMKGRIGPGTRLLDAGCGNGRNLVWPLRAGCDVHALDRDPAAVEAARALVARERPEADAAARVRRGTVQAIPFPDGAFDAVLCMAVLHFSEGDAAFHAAVRELWRVTAPGGMLFVRLASTISMEGRVERVSATDRLFRQPSGKVMWLADLELLLALTDALGGTLLEPVKTTNVQNERAMTTWVVGRPAGTGTT